MNNAQVARLIKVECKNKNVAISKMLADCEIRKSLIYDLEKRNYTPSIESVEKIANYLDVSVDYLLGKTDEKIPHLDTEEIDARLLLIKAEQSVANLSAAARRIARAYEKAPSRERNIVEQVLELYMDKPSATASKEPGAKKYINVIVYDEPAAAGAGNYLNGQESSTVRFPEGVVPRRADFGVRIDGDSMEPEIPNGSIVFVESLPQIEDGEIGIFLLNGNGYCKCLHIDQKKKQVRLVSDNSKYKDIVISESDDLRTFGKVVGHIKR